jgi:hypothetical protein
MKKILLSLIVITTIISCSTPPEAKTPSEKVDPNLSGFNYRSSVYIDAIKATTKDFENLDSVSYKTKYSDTALFYDNGKITNLTENVKFFETCITKKILIKATISPIWASKFNHLNGTSDDFVYQSTTVKFTKGTKSVEVLYFQGDQFKDGKIVREYSYYDPTNLNLLMK